MTTLFWVLAVVAVVGLVVYYLKGQKRGKGRMPSRPETSSSESGEES